MAAQLCMWKVLWYVGLLWTHILVAYIYYKEEVDIKLSLGFSLMVIFWKQFNSFHLDKVLTSSFRPRAFPSKFLVEIDWFSGQCIPLACSSLDVVIFLEVKVYIVLKYALVLTPFENLNLLKFLVPLGKALCIQERKAFKVRPWII